MAAGNSPRIKAQESIEVRVGVGASVRPPNLSAPKGGVCGDNQALVVEIL